MKKISIMIAILIISSFFAPVNTARADAAPPMNPPGGNVSPEGGTEVQMVAEEVLFDFRQSTDNSAQVSAWFQFHNTGAVDEHLKVRFPLNGDITFTTNPTTGADVPIPLIQDFAAFVGGKKLATQTVKDEDPNATTFFLGYSPVIYWSVFEMDFPAGKDVKLSVNYTFRPTEESYYMYLFYVLATGAGWKGPIGRADVIFRFPYELNDINSVPREGLDQVILGRHWMLEESQIRIYYEDLEPTNQDNIEFTIMKPQLWQEILRQRLKVIAAPDSAASWEALAKAYADVSMDSHGIFYNPQVFDLYITACKRAITIDPKDGAFRAECADNLQNTFQYQNDPNFAAMVDGLRAGVIIADPTPTPLPTEPVPTATLEPTFTSLPTGISTQTPITIVNPTNTPVVPPSTPIPAAPPGQKANSLPLFIGIGLLFMAGGFAGGWMTKTRVKK